MKDDHRIVVGIALGFIVVATFGLLAWQLYGMTPERYCSLAYAAAKNAGIDANGARDCTTTLVKLIDNKNITIGGLLAIVGATVLALLVFLFGLRVKGSGPAGIGVDIGAGEAARVTTETRVERGQG